MVPTVVQLRAPHHSQAIIMGSTMEPTMESKVQAYHAMAASGSQASSRQAGSGHLFQSLIILPSLLSACCVAEELNNLLRFACFAPVHYLTLI
jgi:hypothetical protein